jgi:hypothetical protein
VSAFANCGRAVVHVRDSYGATNGSGAFLFKDRTRVSHQHDGLLIKVISSLVTQQASL